MNFREIISLSSDLLTFSVAVVVVGAVLWAIQAWISDRRQKASSIRRAFPLLGRFRYIAEAMRPFVQQYWVAGDREELPFDRETRSWCYRAAKNVQRTLSFGSTQPMTVPGTPIFLPAPFPSITEDKAEVETIVLGAGLEHPYSARRIINISAMSFGSLGAHAVEALSRGAKKAGCWMNTGEGGISEYHVRGGADLVMQIGTGYFGIRDQDGEIDWSLVKALGENPQVVAIEIKLSQGAKPGKGGILPGAKVTDEIARIRGITPGEDCLSPNRHPHIYNVKDLIDFVAKFREATGKPTGIKFVLGAPEFVQELAEEIKARKIFVGPDFITVDGGDGGSGAAPAALMDNCGLRLIESLPILVSALEDRDLTDRVKVVASGKALTPPAVALALAQGADFIQTARGPMFALGCIMAMECGKGTCPAGITTHDPKLMAALDIDNKTDRVASYLTNLEHEVAIIAHSCGVTDARRIDPHHVRIVQSDGRSAAL